MTACSAQAVASYRKETWFSNAPVATVRCKWKANMCLLAVITFLPRCSASFTIRYAASASSISSTTVLMEASCQNGAFIIRKKEAGNERGFCLAFYADAYDFGFTPVRCKTSYRPWPTQPNPKSPILMGCCVIIPWIILPWARRFHQNPLQIRAEHKIWGIRGNRTAIAHMDIIRYFKLKNGDVGWRE